MTCNLFPYQIISNTSSKIFYIPLISLRKILEFQQNHSMASAQLTSSINANWNVNLCNYILIPANKTKNTYAEYRNKQYHNFEMPIERIVSLLINAMHWKTRPDIITDKEDETSNSLPINWIPINKENHLTIELFMNTSVTHKQICSPTMKW